MISRLLTSPDELTAALSVVSQPSYLQSWAWGEFQEQYGRRVWRLGVVDGQQIRGAMTVIQHTLALGRTYLYVPHGPVATDPEAIKVLLTAGRELGRETRAMYLKVDPPVLSQELEPVVAELDLATTLQPRHTLVLDLPQEPEALLAGMHHKTRYNIRLAEKRGVTVRWSTADEDFEKFMELQTATAQRQGVRFHPRRYFELMFKTMRAVGQTELAVAEYHGQPLVVNQLVNFGGVTVFIHGGSADAHKDVMAPYAIQWQSILRARELGNAIYDFRGIAPPDRPDHKLAGVTRFKLGFGGRSLTYPPARNIIFDRRWWTIYRLAKRFRGGRDE